MPAETRRPPRSQADRRAETRAALLSSAALGLSRYGYGNLNLAEVAAEAGYTRGALYHLFDDKEGLALAVVAWVWETWEEQVGSLGQAVWKLADSLRKRVERLITRGRRSGTIPPGPPARILAAAYLSALEGLAIGVAGRTPHDETLAERTVVGLLRGGSA